MKRALTLTFAASFLIASGSVQAAGRTTNVGATKVTPREHVGMQCNRGCNPNGDCWKLLATYEENIADEGDSPVWITHKRYVGNPYPTWFDATCGAVFVKEHGICTGVVATSTVYSASKILVVLADGSEPIYPSEDECPY